MQFAKSFSRHSRRAAGRLRVAMLGATLLAAFVAAPRDVTAASPGGAYVMRRGSDTLAVERFERAGGVLQGTLLFRVTGMLVRWRLADGPAGGMTRMEASFSGAGDPAGSPPRQRVTLEFAGDSVFSVSQPGGEHRFGTARGAMPFVNPSVALVAEFALRRMPLPGGRAGGALFLLAGGGTTEAVVTRPAVDSVVVSFAGVSFCFGLDRDGDVVRGRVPEQDLTIERVADLPPGLLSLPAPDYSAPAGAPYTAEEVKVPTRDGHVLAGTLTRPLGPGRSPCVITLTGSGQQDRDEAIGIVRGYRPFRGVADALGRRSIATLRLDDRGVGATDAPARGATSETFAHDAEDALAWLRGWPDVDGDRLALIGHSEGGLVAPIVAGRDPKLRALVLLAAPAWTGRRVLEYQNDRALARYSPASPRDSALRAAMAEVDSLAVRDAWLRFFLDHDPMTAIARVRVPVLLLQGETDRQVTAGQAEELASALARAGNRDVTVRVFPRLNHLFLDDPDGDPSGYPRLSGEGFSPAVVETLAVWLTKRLR